MEKQYTIVCFPDEDDAVGIVPQSWCIGKTQCYWPPFTTDARVKKAVKTLQGPEESWAVLKIRYLGSKETYERARMFLEKAQETSDMQTEDELEEKKRKRRQNTKYLNDVGSEEESEEDAEVHQTQSKKSKKTLPKAPKPPNPPNAAMVSNSVPSPMAPSPGSSISSGVKDVHRQQSTLQEESVSSHGTGTVSSREYCSPQLSPSPGPSSAQDVDMSSPIISTPLGRVRQYHNKSPVISPRPTNSPVPSPGPLSRADQLENASNGSHVTATEKLLIRILTGLEHSVADLKKQVERNTKLLQNLQPGGAIDVDYTLPEGVVMPANNNQQLLQLEDAVEGDKELQKYLITSLASRGGHNVQDCVKRMLGDLITTKFMRECNWTGQGEKTEFRKLKIRRILQKAIRRNIFTKDATDAEIQKEVCRYLKGAKDREGGRKNRQKSCSSALAAGSNSTTGVSAGIPTADGSESD